MDLNGPWVKARKRRRWDAPTKVESDREAKPLRSAGLLGRFAEPAY